MNLAGLTALLLLGSLVSLEGCKRLHDYDENTKADLHVITGQGESDFLQSDTAKELLGSPLHVDKLVGENLNELGDTGQVVLNQSVHGSKQTGLLNIEARKSGGVWTVTHVDLKPADQGAWHSLVSSNQAKASAENK